MEKTIFTNYILYDNGSIFSIHSNKYMNISYKESMKCARVDLRVFGKRKTYRLHNLVARFFLREYNSETDLITFKDNNPMNCNIKNLIVNKNGRITKPADEEMNAFFLSQNPYQIVWGFIKYALLGYGSPYRVYFTEIYEIEDLVQDLITLLHRRTNAYLIRFKDKYSFGSYAFNLFKKQFSSGDMYKRICSLNSMTKVQIESELENNDQITKISYIEYITTQMIEG